MCCFFKCNLAVAATEIKTISPQATQTIIASEAGSIIEAVPAKLEIKSNTSDQQSQQQKQQSKEEDKKDAETKVEEIPLLPAAAHDVSTQVSNSTANKSETTAAVQAKSTIINDDEQNLENSLPDSPVFEESETQTPDKDLEANMELGGDLGDDDDDAYPDEVVRDNNRNEPISNKFPQEPIANDIDGAVVDSVPKVQVPFQEDPDSNFFTYICIIMFLSILLYILYHNRQKILALVLEGRRGSRRTRDRSSRSGSKAAYSKLDCNLEEAITSKKSLNSKSMDIIY